MNLFKIILVLATIITTTLVASQNDTSSTKKPEENKTNLTTTKPSELKTEPNIFQSAPNKRSIAGYGNHGYNNNNPLYQYNKYEPNRYETRSRKSKSRNRKSRQKNKKSGRFNRVGRERQVFGSDNNTPQVKIENTKPIININFDSIYKDPNNNDQRTNLKNHIAENAPSNDMKYQQEKRKPRSGANQSKVEHSTPEIQKNKYGNNNTTAQPIQQTLIPDSKKFVAENNLSVSNNLNINQGPKLPDTQNKVLNITSIKIHEPTIVAEVQPQKPDVLEHKLLDFEQGKIEVKNNKNNVGDINVVSTFASISAPNLSKSEVETKKTDAENKKLETKSAFELKMELKSQQSDINVMQTLPVNIQTPFELKTIKLESKNTESDFKTENSQNLNTNPKNTNFEFDKNTKPITKDKEYQPVSTKTERKENRKRENNISELQVTKTTSIEHIKTEVKSESKNSETTDDSAKAAVKPSYTSIDIKNEATPELKKDEPDNRKLNTERTNKGPEYTSIDLDDLLSELGIKASEPEIEKVSVRTKSTPESNKLAIAKLKPDLKKVKPTESIHKISYQEENLKSKETEFKQPQAQPDFKGIEIEKPRTLRKAEIEKIETKNIFDENSETKLQKLIPNEKLQPKRSTFDPKYKAVDVRSSRYDPYSKETRIDDKKPNPETKYYEATNPRPLPVPNRPKYEKPEKQITNSSPEPKDSQPDYHEVTLELGNSKPGQKKVEGRREHRQSKSEDRELKPKIPISILTARDEPGKSKNIPLRTRTDNPKYKNPISPNYQSTVVEYETSTQKSKKIIPEYIKRESKYSTSEPKDQRSETRYKKSPFPLVSQQKKDRPQEKDQFEYDRKADVAPKREYVNSKHVPRKFKTNFQESKTTFKDRAIEIKKPIPELRRNDPKYRSSKRESIPYEPKYKEVKPGTRKVVRDYEKPDYQIRESEYRKPRYEKYQPEIRRNDDDSLKAGPLYAFKNKNEAKVKVYSNDARDEKKTTFKRKYGGDKKNDEPQYNESKIEYKISENKDKNSKVEYKKAEAEDRKSTTEKFLLESTAPLSEHSITGPDEKEENSTPKQNFFYKAIKDWW